MQDCGSSVNLAMLQVLNKARRQSAVKRILERRWGSVTGLWPGPRTVAKNDVTIVAPDSNKACLSVTCYSRSLIREFVNQASVSVK